MIKKMIFPILLSCNLFSFDLTVKVEDLRNSNGVVQFSLYNKDGSIPDEYFKKTFKQLKVSILDNKAKTLFKNLPKGRYAINVLHDENSNAKIDKGFMLPTEGVGFSNFKTLNLFHKPTFEKTSFLLDKNKTLDIKVIYF